MTDADDRAGSEAGARPGPRTGLPEAEVVRRQRFASGVAAEFADLAADDLAWDGYLAEAEATSVDDGTTPSARNP